MTIAVKCDTVGGKLGQRYRENQKSDPQVKDLTRLLTQLLSIAINCYNIFDN